MDIPAAEDAILQLERGALNQWSSGNPTGYAQSAAEDVTYFDDIGAQSRVDGRHALLEYLATLQGSVPPHRYDVLDPKVQAYGDVAILTLRYQPSSLDGEPLAPWKTTTIYRRSNEEWQMVHAHWSMIKSDSSN
jgi:Domain of unknown function (DUF4440)